MYLNLYKISSVILIVVSLVNGASATTLKPSLATQIRVNEKIQKENIISQKKSDNLTRLADLRRANATRKTVATFYGVRSPTSSTTHVGPPVVSQDFSKLRPTLSTIGSADIPTKNITSNLVSPTQAIIPGVDMVRVREAWFGWYNEYRRSLGLGAYTYDPRLDVTAHDWNLVFSASKGQNHHERNPGDGYYNFPVIDKWFIARGINPKVIDRAKHTENDGYGYYRCTDTDCTDELIASIRTTWNYFLSEKGKSYDAHYRTIIQPHFTKMGLDIMVRPGENRYYMVIHFITE